MRAVESGTHGDYYHSVEHQYSSNPSVMLRNIRGEDCWATGREQDTLPYSEMGVGCRESRWTVS